MEALCIPECLNCEAQLGRRFISVALMEVAHLQSDCYAVEKQLSGRLCERCLERTTLAMFRELAAEHGEVQHKKHQGGGAYDAKRSCPSVADELVRSAPLGRASRSHRVRTPKQQA